MKKFSIYCTDSPNTGQIRADSLPGNLTHIEAVMERILIAGPLVSEAGDTIGSMFIITAEDEKAAQDFLEGDPYHKAGIWETIKISEFNAVVGEYIGGKTW